MNEKALDHKCPSCGAPIGFKPSAGKWVCEYCDSGFSLEELQKYDNASSEKANNSVKADNTEYDSYKCKDCGAEIIADDQTAATFCLYCGNVAILKSKLSGAFSPDKIIPFKVEKDAAKEAFKSLSKGRPFMPKTFNELKNIEKITGLYIPFWLYDLTVSGNVRATATKVTSWRSGEYMHTKTDTYNVFRSGQMGYERIPADGSTRFDDDIMTSVEPFNYDEMVDYNHAYLSGFLAEKYDVDATQALEPAKARAINTTTDEMKNTMLNYTTKIVTENTLGISSETHKYALLPVWMVNIKYNDKFYLFAMNGQTGEFVGNIPLDKKKVIIWTISLFLILFLVFIIGSYIIYLVGA